MSRMQTICSEYNADLVISESIDQNTLQKNQFAFSLIADIEVKGISKKQLVYQVEKAK